MLISQTPIGRDGWSRRDLSKCALMSAMGRKQTLANVHWWTADPSQPVVQPLVVGFREVHDQRTEVEIAIPRPSR
jgi:hypothetical protein